MSGLLLQCRDLFLRLLAAPDLRVQIDRLTRLRDCAAVDGVQAFVEPAERLVEADSAAVRRPLRIGVVVAAADEWVVDWSRKG